MGIFDSIRSALKSRSRGEAELDYLNESMSRTDLEIRQREIDRGRFRNLPRRR